MTGAGGINLPRKEVKLTHNSKVIAKLKTTKRNNQIIS